MIKAFWILYFIGLGVAVFHEPGAVPWLIGAAIACLIYGAGKREHDRDMRREGWGG